MLIRIFRKFDDGVWEFEEKDGEYVYYPASLHEDIDDEGDWTDLLTADGDLLFHPCGPAGGRC